MKPMLAAEAVLGQIKYPVCGSFKLNGVRGLVVNGKLLARSLKPIPNQYTRQLFSRPELEGVDGELVVGPHDAEEVFVDTTSGVMTEKGEPPVVFHIFDRHDLPALPFATRTLRIQARLATAVMACPELQGRLRYVKQLRLHSDAEVVALGQRAVALGYEGLVLRCPESLYKFGRSTEQEGGFLRFCSWVTGEAEVLEVEEGETNTNPLTRNELGYAKRSLHQAGLQKTGMAGSLRVRERKTGVEFNIPIGPRKLKHQYWQEREQMKGRWVRYRARSSVKTAPRYPQLEGFRDARDL